MGALLKFAMPYSCGKDSTFALHKMVEAGHEPVCLVVMMNESVNRSFFHGDDPAMLRRYSEALDHPLVACRADADSYELSFEDGLRRAKLLGAEGGALRGR